MGKKTAESKVQRIDRACQVLAILEKTYPEATCSLDFKSPFELICATILSAQCTDVRVNMVTPTLFKKYPDAKTMAKAKLSDVEKLVQSTGFYKNKSKSLVECAKSIVAKHAGAVPRTMDELTELRGVGRKTANVVLGNAFGLPGLPVDTHVGRLSRRLGLTKNLDPVKVEHELGEMIPPERWSDFSHFLIFHGRARCVARKPDCLNCEVAQLCPKVGVAVSTARPARAPAQVSGESLRKTR